MLILNFFSTFGFVLIEALGVVLVNLSPPVVCNPSCNKLKIYSSINRSRIRFANLCGSLFNNDVMHNHTEKIQITIISFLY